MAVIEPSTFRGGPLTLSHWALLDPLGRPEKLNKMGEWSFLSSQCDASPDFSFKSLFYTLFCTAVVTGGLHRNNHQSGRIPDHSIPVSSHHPPFKRSQERKWRMILAEIKGNFLWKGEQNYLGLKHSRAIDNFVLGRKAPRSFISSCEGFGFASKPNNVFVAEWSSSVWEVRCKGCGLGSTA